VIRRGAFGAALIAALALTLAFLTLPIVAIFLDVPLRDLLGSLDDEAATQALRLSLPGVLAGLGSGLSWAVFQVLGKRALEVHHPLTVSAFTAGAAALALLPLQSAPLPPNASKTFEARPPNCV